MKSAAKKSRGATTPPEPEPRPDPSEPAEAEQPVDWVDDRELARRTPLSRACWATHRSRGKGPPYYKAGKRVLYKWPEVVAWLESGRIEPKKAS